MQNKFEVETLFVFVNYNLHPNIFNGCVCIARNSDTLVKNLECVNNECKS